MDRDFRQKSPTNETRKALYSGTTAAELRPAEGQALTLAETATAVGVWETGFTEIAANIGDLRFQPEGVVKAGHTFRMDGTSRRRLFRRLSAPVGYLEKHTAEFQAAALSEHARHGDFGQRVSLILRNEELIMLARGDLRSLSNSAVIAAVREGLGSDGDSLLVQKIGIDYDRLQIDAISPTKAVVVRPGDIVQAGLRIVHHRFGGPATTIEAFILRLVCANGMTRRECQSGCPSRTRKLPVDFANGEELQKNQIRRLAQQSWHGLRAQLEAVKTTAERPASVDELLTRWLQRTRLSVKNMLALLMDAWREEGAENSVYGAVNAITRVATHDQALSERQRRTLAALAGLLSFSHLHICDRCFSILQSGPDQSD